ncbi:TIM14 [Cardiosporidium cionae]|uniref:TIM14 n=1 Tax=Cardiosporidium cionae TaxID=476202 RepID=A0ABQ7JDL3_9APIC|nr:TIM14 [Cardiosporidium cionae]|eukprot:KAF8822095.1 TIM14 [Cardiosporidium cionae]
MVWPLVALAVGVSALGLRTGVRLLRQANLEMPSISTLPYIHVFRNLTVDQRGFVSPMSRIEACQILNLSPTASKEKIREHHKQLMMRNHPDNGGSTYVAAKVNEAKEVLLKS